VTIESDFATMIIVCLDMAGKTLTCTSAGHEVCYLVRGDRLIERLDPTGPILGIRGLSEWSQQTLSFEHGDRLILLTDGVTETMSPDEQMYGSDRLVGLISANAALPLEALFELVVQDINSFRGGNRQTDDITIVAVDL
jgi:sigma-B regulation protein RsbU (phosphoserine phosphatase)